MKKLIFLIPLLFLISSCSNNNSGNNPLGAIGGGIGGGGTGNVTFTATLVQDQNTQDSYFQLTPSTNVTVESANATCQQAGFNNEPVTGLDGTTIYSTTSPFYIGPVTNVVATGQSWSFTISGKIGGTTGSTYTANASTTIQ